MNARQPARAPAVGSVVAERYRLERFMSVSGYGCVYQASTAGGAAVALKLLFAFDDSDGDGQLLDRFRREIEVLGNLNHPNIVPLLDAGFDPRLAVPFLLMPLLSGNDLAQQIERVGALHPTVVARIFSQVCAGLDAAHQQGVVHRGIKPANIFLDRRADGQTTVRLLDFGLAKQFDAESHASASRGSSNPNGAPSHNTSTGTMLGTPRYMAPEQLIDSKSVDARADVWGAGASMFAALSGEPPFRDAIQLLEVIDAIVSGAPLRIQQYAPWVEPELASIVDAAVLRDIDARCPDAREMARALTRLIHGASVIEPGMLAGVSPQIARCTANSIVTQSWRSREAENSRHRTQPLAPSVLVTPDDSALGNTLLGKVLGGYTLQSQLGRGGMGAVYEATNKDGDNVAIKVMWGGPSANLHGLQRRFVREARAAMKIHSPHVVSVLAADTDAQLATPYIVMEKLSGLDVGRLLKRGGPMAPEHAARLLIDACRGVAAAHALEIIHRDIKPANLFLCHLPSGETRITICDFGIAKQLGEAAADTEMLTNTGGMVGSPHYMSPEQAKDAKTVDQRSDIWSLGISLYKMLAGQTPWGRARSVGSVVLAICTEDAPPLRDKAPWVAKGLADVVHRALRRDPEARFASVAEMAHALAAYAAPGPILYRDLLLPFMPAQGMTRTPIVPEATQSSTTTSAIVAAQSPLPTPQLLNAQAPFHSPTSLPQQNLIKAPTSRGWGPRAAGKRVASGLLLIGVLLAAGGWLLRSRDGVTANDSTKGVPVAETHAKETPAGNAASNIPPRDDKNASMTSAPNLAAPIDASAIAGTAHESPSVPGAPPTTEAAASADTKPAARPAQQAPSKQTGKSHATSRQPKSNKRNKPIGRPPTTFKKPQAIDQF